MAGTGYNWYEMDGAAIGAMVQEHVSAMTDARQFLASVQKGEEYTKADAAMSRCMQVWNGGLRLYLANQWNENAVNNAAVVDTFKGFGDAGGIALELAKGINSVFGDGELKQAESSAQHKMHAAFRGAFTKEVMSARSQFGTKVMFPFYMGLGIELTYQVMSLSKMLESNYCSVDYFTDMETACTKFVDIWPKLSNYCGMQKITGPENEAGIKEQRTVEINRMMEGSTLAKFLRVEVGAKKVLLGEKAMTAKAIDNATKKLPKELKVYEKILPLIPEAKKAVEMYQTCVGNIKDASAGSIIQAESELAREILKTLEIGQEEVEKYLDKNNKEVPYAFMHYDTMRNLKTLENHLARIEFKDPFQSGTTYYDFLREMCDGMNRIINRK